jgi:hypothetical protein
LYDIVTELLALHDDGRGSLRQSTENPHSYYRRCPFLIESQSPRPFRLWTQSRGNDRYLCHNCGKEGGIVSFPIDFLGYEEGKQYLLGKIGVKEKDLVVFGLSFDELLIDHHRAHFD